MSSSTAAFCLDHIAPQPSEQLCYVHCSFCDTILAVSVPYSILFKTVTVRCGHCAGLLPVNMRSLLMPQATTTQLHHLGHSFLTTSTTTTTTFNNNNSTNSINSNNGNAATSLLDDTTTPCPPQQTLWIDHHQTNPIKEAAGIAAVMNRGLPDQELTHTPLPPVNKPPEKRQRVPSAYNRFIKDEIQRIKAENPDITHREAFSAAAKNWAHFPHIHFGLMPNQALRRNSAHQDGEDMLLKEGFYAAAAAANMGISPF